MGASETLCVNTTLKSLNRRENWVGGRRAGAGRDSARARLPSKTLRVNTTSMSLSLGSNCLGEGGGRALAETLRDSLLNKALLRMFSFNLSLPAFS
jgi:hypothetical protein